MIGTITWVTVAMRCTPPKMISAVNRANTTPAIILMRMALVPSGSKELAIEPAIELDCTALNTKP